MHYLSFSLQVHSQAFFFLKFEIAVDYETPLRVSKFVFNLFSDNKKRSAVRHQSLARRVFMCSIAAEA